MPDENLILPYYGIMFDGIFVLMWVKMVVNEA